MEKNIIQYLKICLAQNVWYRTKVFLHTIITRDKRKIYDENTRQKKILDPE